MPPTDDVRALITALDPWPKHLQEAFEIAAVHLSKAWERGYEFGKGQRGRGAYLADKREGYEG